MILVTGASGHLGRAVIQNLVKHYPANHIVGFVRDKSKVSELQQLGIQIRVGDYESIESIKSAMMDVEKVLLISGTNEERRVGQHKNVIDAAKDANVKCIAYTSRLVKNQDSSKNHLMEGHFKTEELIFQSGLDHIIFRNALYMDTIPVFVGGDNVFETCRISLPAGNGRVSFALRAELAEAIAKVLLRDDLKNQIIPLTANKSWSLYDVANVLTEISGKKIEYIPIDRAEFVSRLLNLGLPEILVNRYADFQIEIRDGFVDEVTSDLEKNLGREPAQLQESLKRVFDV